MYNKWKMFLAQFSYALRVDETKTVWEKLKIAWSVWRIFIEWHGMSGEGKPFLWWFSNGIHVCCLTSVVRWILGLPTVPNWMDYPGLCLIIMGDFDLSRTGQLQSRTPQLRRLILDYCDRAKVHANFARDTLVDDDVCFGKKLTCFFQASGTVESNRGAPVKTTLACHL